MVAIAPHIQATPLILEGVTWPTFQALIAELTVDPPYQITYGLGQLQIEDRQPQGATENSSLTLHGLSWSTFKRLIEEVGDHRTWRITYVPGALEVRMPLEEHEEPKRLLEDFVTTMVDELGIELRSLGSLTLERAELSRAVEPDSCFYIQNELRVRGRKIHLPEDPPPDLVIESDYTHSSLNRLGIYAMLGVPELWRYSQKTFQVYLLVEGQYQLSDQSLAFPCLPVASIPELIEQSKVIGQRATVRLFQDRIRAWITR
ncbi:Uma2 family endonuclease [Synechococcales cyanobacterium C]|uniref:Uma2 family endonuclease n=1 Tax=Petrachloros mirabilis ULC683 TaxID=2781853 RepID=A0A8K2A6K8_9CYAN|nr:Uma2 family endonuclease [Petrachloros mirabilis]NCJ05320.1 Uma2 family endonuclease [Petrachloros mirabilis ULC683]